MAKRRDIQFTPIPPEMGRRLDALLDEMAAVVPTTKKKKTAAKRARRPRPS